FSIFGLGGVTTGDGVGTTGDGDIGVTADSGTSGSSGSGSGGRNCFIATAAYGTPMAAEIDILCAFRDRHLLKNRLGKAFVKFYYKNSPPLADYIGERPYLRRIVRGMLRPVVALVRSTMQCK
ncbi:MAG: CFI-box-CTERM domain-containing protein, partial [Candidatus Omnitrophota bacterium]